MQQHLKANNFQNSLLKQKMSVTKFCILIVILFDYHRHFHSSLQVLARTEEEWDMRKARVKLPVKLVPFRHSKLYSSNTKPSQFTSYESGTNKGVSGEVHNSSSSNIYLHDHHHQIQQDAQDLSPYRKVLMHRKSNSRNYLINTDVRYSTKTNFLQFPTSNSPAPLDRSQTRHKNESQGWRNGIKGDSGFHGRTTSSIFPITNARLPRNIRTNNTMTMSIRPSFIHLTDPERSESVLSPVTISLTKFTLSQSMPTSPSIRLPSPTSATWINETSTVEEHGRKKQEKTDKVMHFYETLFPFQKQSMLGKQTSSEPFLGLTSTEPLSQRLSSSPNLLSMSKQKHLLRTSLDRYSISQTRQSEKDTTVNLQNPFAAPSKPDEIAKNKYFSTQIPLMNYSIGHNIEDEDVQGVTTRSDRVRSSSTAPSNYSVLFPQTMESDMTMQYLRYTPTVRETTDTYGKIKDPEESFGTFIHVSSPIPESDEEDERSELIKNFKSKYPVKIWAAAGFYDDAYLESINSHWLQYDPADPLVHKMLGILYGILMVIGCGGNLLVIVMFVRCRSLRTPPNYLIVNLAVSDFFMMVKMPVFIYNSLYEGPALGVVGCKIYGFLGGLTGTASITTLTAISLDRYYVIVYPMNPMKRTTSARALLMVLGVWLYSGLFSSMPLFGLNGYVSEGYLTSCSFDYLSEKMSDRIFVAIFFVAAFVFPLSVIVFSYTRIFQMVREAERVEFFSPGNGNGGPLTRESFKYKHDQKKNKTEFKIAMLSSAIILIWLLAWTPYAMVALLGIFGYKNVITPFVSSVPALFCKTASCIDPFLYAINHPRFQRELKNKFKFCYSQKKPRASPENSFYSNSCKDDNSENSLKADPKRKQSPPTARGSPDSVKTPKHSGSNSNTNSTVLLQEIDSTRLAKLSRNSNVVAFNLQNNFGTTGAGDETNILTKGRKVEICLVEKARQGSSPIKKHKDQESAHCDDTIKTKGANGWRRTSSLPDSDDKIEHNDAASTDNGDLRMKDVLLRKNSKKSYSRNSTRDGGGSACNNVIGKSKVLYGKSLSADCTSRSISKLHTTKLETTIM